MEENKFEKQVQQKMDELQIQPSDAVWEKIESQIGKKKGRRWGLIILFLLIGLILSGSYWLWNTRQQTFSERNNSVEANSEKISSQTSAKENETIQQKSSSVPESVNQKNTKTASVIEKSDDNKNNTQHYKFLTDSKTNQKINSKEKKSIAFYEKNEITGEIHGNNEAGIMSAQSSQNQSANKNINKESDDSIYEKMNADSLSQQVVSNVVTKDINTSKQTNTETVKQSNKNKWKFGILFSGGISGAGNNFLGLNNSIPKDFSNSVTPGQTNPGQTLQILPSLIKSGFGFVTGVLAEKSISQKTKFALGINFKSFNTSIRLYDSSGIYRAAAYSLSPGVNKYIRYVNHFNFIEVPVSIKIQIGKGKNIPLVWQGGLAVAELISSNALQINSYNGYYYYRDNSIFNKTQIGFNTGFFASLFSKQKTSILIGPYFYYDASKIANEGLYSKKHFVFAGLRTEIIFSK
jgi:tetrahydromethanopterin S-methyltransferase subunit G